MGFEILCQSHAQWAELTATADMYIQRNCRIPGTQTSIIQTSEYIFLVIQYGILMDQTTHQFIIPFEFNGIKIIGQLSNFTVQTVSPYGYQ